MIDEKQSQVSFKTKLIAYRVGIHNNILQSFQFTNIFLEKNVLKFFTVKPDECYFELNYTCYINHPFKLIRYTTAE